jgi:opacity protein-like surface antigen
MKKHESVGLVGVCMGAVCLTANAQSNQSYGGTRIETPPPNYSSFTPHAYVGASLGGDVTLDSKVKEFFGPIPNTKIRFDPGVHVGFVGGYQLCDWFSVEGETGVYFNQIDSIDGASFSGSEFVEQVPMLANVRLQWPSHGRCRLTPYIGGGVGGSVSVIDFQDDIDLNGVVGNGSAATVVFAYQAFAGLRYAITQNIDIGVEYHYFVTTGSDWSFDNTFGTQTDHVKFAGTQTHSASVAVKFRF